MYERFTDRARQTMQQANMAAQRLGHEYVGTEHILLGLIAVASEEFVAVLRSRNISPEILAQSVRRHLTPSNVQDNVVMGRLPHTPRAKKVIEFAIEESRHNSYPYVGTGQLLAGLVRETDGVAYAVLTHYGITIEVVRAITLCETPEPDPLQRFIVIRQINTEHYVLRIIPAKTIATGNAQGITVTSEGSSDISALQYELFDRGKDFVVGNENAVCKLVGRFVSVDAAENLRNYLNQLIAEEPPCDSTATTSPPEPEPTKTGTT